jgi:hypothetical protein
MVSWYYFQQSDGRDVLKPKSSIILRSMRICGFEKGLNYKILIAA